MTKTLGVKAVKLAKTGVELWYQITKTEPVWFSSVSFHGLVLCLVTLSSAGMQLFWLISRWRKCMFVFKGNFIESRSLEEEEEKKNIGVFINEVYFHIIISAITLFGCNYRRTRFIFWTAVQQQPSGFYETEFCTSRVGCVHSRQATKDIKQSFISAFTNQPTWNRMTYMFVNVGCDLWNVKQLSFVLIQVSREL